VFRCTQASKWTISDEHRNSQTIQIASVLETNISKETTTQNMFLAGYQPVIQHNSEKVSFFLFSLVSRLHNVCFGIAEFGKEKKRKEMNEMVQGILFLAGSGW
jgi:hypothetical protein